MNDISGDRPGELELKVAVVGIGMTPFRPLTPEHSWKELTYDAATRAYADANLDPRSQVDSFVTCAEDYWEGFGIFDEFVPDQLGAVLRPVCTVSGDGLLGVATAHMQILSGVARVVVVEAHSKASNILSYSGITQHALDPVFNKPLGGNPVYVAGLEMSSFLRINGIREETCALVIEKNRGNALLNPRACYGARVTTKQVLKSEKIADPLKDLDISRLADGAVVVVLAAEDAVRDFETQPVWIRGMGWSSDIPWLETRRWGEATYALDAASKAYSMARVRSPSRSFSLCEVDDRYSYKEIQHILALGITRKSDVARDYSKGAFSLEGRVPVNPSGGSLGNGDLLEATGLRSFAEVVLQLRGEAGRHQIEGAETALVQSWRGIPTASGAVAVLGVKT